MNGPGRVVKEKGVGCAWRDGSWGGNFDRLQNGKERFLVWGRGVFAISPCFGCFGVLGRTRIISVLFLLSASHVLCMVCRN